MNYLQANSPIMIAFQYILPIIEYFKYLINKCGEDNADKEAC